MATLRDGLGGEEVTTSGLAYSGGGGVPSQYVGGSLTVVDQISGANVYSTANVHGVEISGTTVAATTSVTSDGIYGEVAVSGLTISGSTVRGTAVYNNEGELENAGWGSGPTYGAQVIAGSSVLSSNGAWVTYSNTTFTGSPFVQVTNVTKASGLVIPPGSIGCGSFYCSGENTTDVFHWMALGPI